MPDKMRELLPSCSLVSRNCITKQTPTLDSDNKYAVTIKQDMLDSKKNKCCDALQTSMRTG